MINRIAGGASAKPFSVHHSNLKMDLFMRTAPELYLKVSIRTVNINAGYYVTNCIVVVHFIFPVEHILLTFNFFWSTVLTYRHSVIAFCYHNHSVIDAGAAL